jgi:hypothetical protein
MKKKTIFTLIMVTLVTLLLSTGPVVAQTETIPFDGERCRNSINILSIEEVDGRHKATMEAFWTIENADELVDGEWHNYDSMWNREILGYLPSGIAILGIGISRGRVRITPVAVNGYWEGNWHQVWTGGGDTFMQAELKGKGDLEGLKLVIDMENPELYGGINCEPPFQGSLQFYGYILNPGGKWEMP